MMASITDSRREKISNEVVDAVSNPTELFRRINSGDWDGSLDAVQTNPAEASIWISRRKSDYDGLAWKYLPLHLICLQQRPPVELLRALLHFYPQAASLPTPHDGSLPIHYVCESGCDDEQVFAALLASAPGTLEMKNGKDKTPLLMCHSKSRGILMKVLRQRKSLPFNDGKERNRREKKERKKSKKPERRNDIDTSWKDTTAGNDRRQPPQRRPPQTTPARYARRSSFADTDADEPSGWEVDTPRVSNHRSSSIATPKVSNHRRSSKKEQPPKKEPLSFFSSSSSGDEDTDTASYISHKSKEFALSALTYLYPSYQGQEEPPQQEPQQPPQQPPQQEPKDDSVSEQVLSLTKENAGQKQTIDELTKQLDRLNSSNEANTENSRLCERILAKAEADNVAFRTQIQKLQAEKDEMKRAADLKERKNQKSLDQTREIICEKAAEMKIKVFDDGSCSSHSSGSGNDCEGNDQIPDALQTLLSHMDQRNNNLHSTVATLEANLSKSEVMIKKTRSKNQILQEERDSTVKKHRELERKITILEEEKGTVQTGLGDLKNRVSTLTVINQSLQEQVESMSNGQVKQENDQFQSELKRLNTQLSQMKEESDNAAQIQYEHQKATEMEKKIESLLEKNRTLRDTILSNNEKYSKKVQELGEKLEKANKRQSLASRSSSSAAPPSMRVHLEGENKLLYEV